MDSDISIAGIKSDHTEAATIMPDAKPRSAFWTPARISFFNKNTHAAPSAVPANGIIIPKNIFIYSPVFSSYIVILCQITISVN